MNPITLGSDPEVFATNGHQVIPAFFAMGGDVDWPLPFGKAYPDGAAIEFTVEPSSNPFEIARRISLNLAEIHRRLQERGLSITLKSNADVGEFIPDLPEEYGTRASLQILGCSKDIRVYDWVEEHRRPNPKVYPFRTIGTHIHVALERHVTDNWPLVQFITAFLDATVGSAAIFLLDGDGDARQRAILYGKAGTIRIKASEIDGYDAIEYRCCASHAVLSSESSTAAFFLAAKLVAERIVTLYEAEGFPTLLKLVGGVEGLYRIQETLDDFNISECRKLHAETMRALDLPVDMFEGCEPKTNMYSRGE